MTEHAAQVVAEARATLATAEAQLKAERIEEVKRKLSALRRTGRELKRRFEELVAIVRQGDAECERCEVELSEIRAAFDMHNQCKPDAQNFPSDEELERWQAEVDGLIALRMRVLERKTRAASKQARRVEAIELDGELLRLRYAQRQLEGIVRGEMPGAPRQGGISRV